MHVLHAALFTMLLSVVSQPLQGSLIVGSEAFSLTGVTDNYIPAGANLLDITDFNSFTLQSSSGNWLNTSVNDPLGNTLSLGVSGLHIATLDTFSFGVAAFGVFQATAAQQSSSTQFGQLSRTFFFNGLFTPGTAFTDSLGHPFDATPVTFTLTFNQSGGAGSSISGSATLNAPPVQDIALGLAPEPASLGMFATMGLPLLFGWFRRKSELAV